MPSMQTMYCHFQELLRQSAAIEERIVRTTRITGRRELTLISKSTGHRRSRACDGSVAYHTEGGRDAFRRVPIESVSVAIAF